MTDHLPQDDAPKDRDDGPHRGGPPDSSPEDDSLSSVSIPLTHALGAAFAGAVDHRASTPDATTSDAAASERKPLDADQTIDDRLIDCTLAGQSSAYGELVGRYQDRLRASLTRLTGSAEEAEDVAQEAFVQAYLKLSSFQRSSRFYTWIYRIAFNQAISKGRKRRPRVSLNAVQEAGGVEPLAEATGPTESTFQGERAELLHAAIAELEEDHRQVIVLREFEEMDYQQIAELIGAPIGTVRSRLFRARSQLRERLAETLGEV
ncbi:ECF RNA polymerase sigma factor SigW [Botrimarina colliarenosi]|uniref:RNA polymerase sigma factor n=1 Tax=Botrimarina colliarenosi TaxID=2528001 RepID=A0A5C6AMT6_9BACT|nr:sigma-70 family RNA polymerase sigma factor [Botrimarina colliarenosi]TWU00721.1 ECF RNA polymerase sigma factor SigW [Botrimarina colliarenosi]